MKGGTGEIARQLASYYRGGRRVFKYGRWEALKWACQMVIKDIREQHQPRH